jgi:hypothetical protein
VVWLVPAATAGAVSGLVVSAPSTSGLLGFVTIHLTLLVALGLAVAWDLGRAASEPWFLHLSPMARGAATAASIVAMTTGVVALVTLASSAALRYEPSMQFLQLLSALDIAWVTAATFVGLSWLWSRRAGVGAAVGVAALCVWSIWNYLRIVGFASDGGWIVDGAALFRHVLPYDTAAAAIAVTTLVLGARARGLRRSTAA